MGESIVRPDPVYCLAGYIRGVAVVVGAVWEVEVDLLIWNLDMRHVARGVSVFRRRLGHNCRPGLRVQVHRLLP